MAFFREELREQARRRQHRLDEQVALAAATSAKPDAGNLRALRTALEKAAT